MTAVRFRGASDGDPDRVLVVAPFGQDGQVACRVLSGAGLAACPCASVEELCREIGAGARAALLAEEALVGEDRSLLSATLTAQPSWSDFPVLVMASRRTGEQDGWHAVRQIEGSAHVTLLERPLLAATLVSAVRVAVHSRRRQYQVRDELLARRQAEEALRHLNEALEETVEHRTRILRILQDVTRSANQARTVDAAMEMALERITRYDGWRAGQVWHLAPRGSGEGDDPLSRLTAGTSFVAGGEAHSREWLRRLECTRDPGRISGSLVAEVLGSGELRWLDDVADSADPRRDDLLALGLEALVALPVAVHGEVLAVLEFFSDHPMTRNEEFLGILPDVGIQLGHVLRRRRLERDVADSAAELQRRIGSELHDSVGQDLTGVGMMAELLRADLEAAGSPAVDHASALVDQLQRTHDQVRRLSRGLLPVEVGGEGLMTALDDLAESVSLLYRVPCTFHCNPPVVVGDSDAALHLFRIAQEAAQNAVRHGRPTKIDIALDADEELLTLTVRDDGRGFPQHPRAALGAGLRIMHYRADLIGARLQVEADPDGGVLIICRRPRQVP